MLTCGTAIERLFAHDGSDVEPCHVEVEGQLPAIRRGTWYLNGPGQTHCNGLRYGHWLDGDGLIRAIRVGEDGVTFSSRFVRTRKYVAEEASGRPLFRTFGTSFAGDRLNERGTGLESPANVCVLKYGSYLLALGEQGEPWIVDPERLETLGPFTAGGSLTSVTPFAAHAKVDPVTGELFNFGVAFSSKRPLLNVFRFAAGGGLVFRSRIPLHCSCTLHDFALGHSVAAFYVSPYVLDVAALRGGCTVIDALSWEPELGSRVMIVSRATGSLLATISVGRQYCLHTIACHDEGDDVVLDVIEMPQPPYDAYDVPLLFERPVDAVPVRLTLDIKSGRLLSRAELSCRFAPEFPVADAGAARRTSTGFWALGMSQAGQHGAKLFDRLLRFSWTAHAVCDQYDAPDGVLFGAEPAVVRDREDRRLRWLLCQAFDTTNVRSGAYVFDADALASGPVARLWWPVPTPMAFHGTYI